MKPGKPGKVRFHEEVRVRNVKAKGKNLPLYTMYEDDADEDDEFGEHMTFNDFDAEADGANFFNDDDDEADFSFDEGGSDGDGHRDEDGSEGDGRDTIERLKGDLFADEEEPQDGLSLGQTCCRSSLTDILP